MHPLKRRKLELDQPSSSLTKPYRSPLRSDDSRGHVRGPDTTASDGRGLTRRSSSQAVSSASPTNIEHPDCAAVQREYATLSRQLTSLRQNLDTFQQALKIRSGERDRHVQTLIAKWKSVVREAAEDLFEGARDSFRSQQTEHRLQEDRNSAFWEEERRNKLTEDEKEMLDIQEAEARAQAEKYGLLATTESDDEDSQTFTLDMMLRQMNIDLSLVGYDPDSQRWVE